MPTVIWSDEAIGNIEAIETYVAGFNAFAARRLVLRIVQAGDSLADHPLRGKLVARDQRVLTSVRPYLIRYRVTGDAVLIIRVRHMARRRR